MKWIWVVGLGLACSPGTAGVLQILDRDGSPTDSYPLQATQCELEGAHLFWTATTAGGKIRVEAPSYRQLSHNPLFSWKFGPKSVAFVGFEDRLAFDWKMKEGVPASECEFEMTHLQGGPRARLQCQNLRSEEMPGILSFQTSWVALDCRTSDR